MATRKKSEVNTKPEEAVVKTEVVENTVKAQAQARNSKKIEIPMTYEIPVKSNVAGGLVYVSSKNRGYEYYWDHTGDIAYLEYGELLSMRNSYRKFFENNWIVVEDSDYTAEEVYKALAVDKYYAFNFGGMDDVFTMSEKQLTEIVPTLTKGFKENIISRAKDLYKEGNEIFDSSKKVKMFEKIFDMKFENIIEE